MKNRKLKRKMEPYFFTFPVMFVLILLFAYPLINSFIMAFQNNILGKPNDVYFNGLDNFKNIFLHSNISIWKILKNTLIYVVVSVGFQFLLGMILALALNKKFKGRGLYQSIVFLPWAFSGFVVGILFRWSFNGEYGIVNNILMKLGIISENIAWLGTEGLSLTVIILAMIWMGIPFFAIMNLAALQSVPKDIYEAADLDGCIGVRRFFKITLPFIKPTIITTLLLRIIWVFNSFDLIVIITEGGPAGSSETLPSYMYTQAFASKNMGMAAALGVILIIILVLFSIVFLKATKYNKEGDF